MSTRNTNPSSVDLVEQPDQQAALAGVKLLQFQFLRGADWCSHRVSVRKQEHQVDVGGKVQFAPAELSHAQHDQPVASSPAARHGAAPCWPSEKSRGAGDHAFGEPRRLTQGLVQGRQSRQCPARRCAPSPAVATGAARRRTSPRPRRSALQSFSTSARYSGRPVGCCSRPPATRAASSWSSCISERWTKSLPSSTRRHWASSAVSPSSSCHVCGARSCNCARRATQQIARAQSRRHRRTGQRR